MPRSPRPAEEGILIQSVYYGYVAASAIARAIPERFAYRTTRIVGGIKARLTLRQRATLQRNLSHVTGLPPNSRVIRKMAVEAYKSYARYWLETFRLVRETPEFFLDRFRCRHRERIDDALARGKGVVIVVGHLGNWDAAGAWVGASGKRLVTVAEVLRPRRMFDFFAAHRARLGMTIYAAEEGVTAKLREEVEGGAVVAILGDRDLKGRGPEVTFFGRRMTLPAGPASIAIKAQVPVLVAGVYGVRFEDGRRGWEAEISEPIEAPAPGAGAVEEMTQEIAVKLEEFIARRPEEWHVFRPLFAPARAVREVGAL